MPKQFTSETYAFIPQFPLIVGGSGSIARHLLFLLADVGVKKVRVLDLNAPRDPPENLEIDFFPCNLITELHKLPDAIHNCDSVFSFVSPDFTKCTEEVLFAVNVTAMKALLEAAKKGTPKFFLYASSIAVTNHFTHIHEGKENDPLPPLETYISAYDKTKRLGEEAVVAASTTALQTVSLRLGGVLASYRDYICRDAFENGFVLSNHGQEYIDYIFAKDVVHAFMLAYERLQSQDNDVAGEVFYITKGEASRGGVTWSEKYKKAWPGMPSYNIPSFVRMLFILCSYVNTFLRWLFGFSLCAMPLYNYLRIARFTHTFDNSKAKRVLGYESSWSIEDALSWIFKDFQARGGKALFKT